MKNRILSKALLILLLSSPNLAFGYKITYNSGPTDAKSNINVLMFKDKDKYVKLCKEKAMTDKAQKILNTVLKVEDYIETAVAPEFSAEEYVLNALGDILLGWLFSVVKAIETDIATIHKHTNQKTGDTMTYVPSNDQQDNGWIYMVIVAARNNTIKEPDGKIRNKDKGTVIFNGRIKPYAEFGLNISYDASASAGRYTVKFEPATGYDDAMLATFILNKDSLVRCHGIEIGTSDNPSNIEGSISDWNIDPKSPFAQVVWDATAQEYTLPKCPQMKTFIVANFVDAWPSWQKVLLQAMQVQAKQPGNPNYNNFKNITGEDMAKKVPGIQSYAGGPETRGTLQQAHDTIVTKNNGSTKICK